MKTLIKTCGCGLTFREEKEGMGKCPACVAKASNANQDDVVRAAGTSEGAKKGWETGHLDDHLGGVVYLPKSTARKMKSEQFTDLETHAKEQGWKPLGWSSVGHIWHTPKQTKPHSLTKNLASDETESFSIHASTNVIHCRSHSSAAGDKLGASQPWKCGERVEFMFMPAGTHTINAGFRNGSIELTVQCDEQTAGAVQASLDAWRQERPKQEPFGCVEHREHEASVRVSASGGFSWKEDGVYLAAEPTTLGAENVNGKVHRSWSPSFTTDADYDKAKEVRGSGGQVTLVFPEGARGSRSNPASITGVDFCVGTLTNKPAFHAMSPVKSSETVTAAGTSEGAKKGWETKLGFLSEDEVKENVKRAWSKGKSLGQISADHGLHIDTAGGLADLHKDIMAGNLKIQTHDEKFSVTKASDHVHAHCSHLLLNDVPDATPEELAAYDRVVDGGGSHMQAVEECRLKRKHAEAATAVESVTLEAIYAERKRATETANSIRAETHGKPLTVEEVYRQTHDVAFKKVEADKGKSIYARAGGNG